MTDTNPFFRFVWRVNALAILAIASVGCLAVAALFASEIYSHFRDRPVVSDVAPAPDGEKPAGPPAQPRFDTRIGTFQPYGAGFYASLIRVPREDAALFRVSSYKKSYDSTALNLLFFDPATAGARRLFPDDSGLIIEQTALRDSSAPEGQIRALLLSYVSADTDGDKQLSAADDQRILIVRPDGSSSATIADGVDALDGTWRPDGSSRLNVFARKGEEVQHIEVDLDSFAVKPGRTLSPKP